MTNDFSERAEQVEAMLQGAHHRVRAGHLGPAGGDRGGGLVSPTLGESGLPFAGVIVNRVHHDVLGDAEIEDLRSALRRRRWPATWPPAWPRTSRTTTCWPGATRPASQQLRAELGDRPLLLVPHLDDDVHDLAGLLRVHRFLFASDAERERLIADVVA